MRGLVHALHHVELGHQLAQLAALLPDLGAGGLHRPVGRHPGQQGPVLPRPGDYAGGEVEIAMWAMVGLGTVSSSSTSSILVRAASNSVRWSVDEHHHCLQLVHMHGEVVDRLHLIAGVVVVMNFSNFVHPQLHVPSGFDQSYIGQSFICCELWLSCVLCLLLQPPGPLLLSTCPFSELMILCNVLR